MGKPFSGDLRERIVRAVQAGRSRHEVARMFGISPSCVIKLMQRFSALGHCRPEKFGGYKQPILAEHEEAVRALLRARPDLTISELWQELTKAGIKVGRSSVGRFVERLDLTYKNVWPAPSASGFVEVGG
jgi:transposase